MISVLVSAYACSPNMGSEPGMAWNWCVNLANYCELHIITEGEFRDKIEAILPTLPQGKNMHFYYNPVPEKVRKMCWNQGDWRFYKYYKEWQKRTLETAEKIISSEKIDIVHQLNMIGFREPGYLWKIEDKPFVWGPIGGLKRFPKAYLKGAGFKMSIFNNVKNLVNIFQIRYDRRVNSALHRADLLISSIPQSYDAIKEYHGLESIVIPETGCYVNKNLTSNLSKYEQDIFELLWVGKFDFRKQLEIALRVIARVKHLNGVKLSICGIGSEEQQCKYKQLVHELGVQDEVIWCGSLPNNEVLNKMETAQLFFFTSVSEDTSTVVLEALSCRLPVLCFDTCGFGSIINEKVGSKIPLSNPQQSIKDFATQIEYLYNNRNLLKQMSENCRTRQQELSWDNKANQVVKLYHSAIDNFAKT